MSTAAPWWKHYLSAEDDKAPPSEPPPAPSTNRHCIIDELRWLLDRLDEADRQQAAKH